MVSRLYPPNEGSLDGCGASSEVRTPNPLVASVDSES